MASDKKGKGSDAVKGAAAQKGASGKAKAGSAPAAQKADAKGAPPPKRKLGIKGAAPWAARHAAKHAAEARARAAEPAPPGSARATIRTPAGADDIKEKLNELLRLSGQLKALRKNLPKNFYEIGQILREVQAKRLYEPRNYPSFDAFLERETELGKELGLKITRIAALFTKDGAMELGLDRLVAALSALEPGGGSSSQGSSSESKIQVAGPKPPPGSNIRPVEPSGRASF